MVAQALIDRCIRQERMAQHELYHALFGLLMGICARYRADRQEAMALLNTGFLKVLQNLAKRRPEVPFEPWARRIMINTVIDDFRQDRERLAVEGLEMPDEHPEAAVANAYLERMEAEHFAGLLERVPPMSRNVFNLFAIDGHSHAEIAAMLGISTGTSKWHVAHARSILQKALAERAMRLERPLVP
ncbi:MAG: RNA polymerase sigma factor [Flavobacteriales bacterium]|jgi:RNA polymerase sigma-70 factor (ECF subfamily)|nr:RNA polymerase sigma factor [Flavobacteriales bacterium]